MASREEFLGLFPKRIRELVDGGVVTVGVHATEDGLDCFVRSVRPHPRLNISTSESFDVITAIELFAKISLEDKSLKGKVPIKVASLTQREKSHYDPGPRLKTEKEMAPELLKQRGWDQIKIGNMTNELPSASLTYHDLGRKEELATQLRCYVVAEKIGPAKAVHRISSDPHRFYAGGARDLLSWWDSSTPEQKFDLLTENKKRGQPPEGNLGGLTPHFAKRMDRMVCPFQNAPFKMDPQEADSSTSTGDEGGAGFTPPPLGAKQVRFGQASPACSTSS